LGQGNLMFRLGTATSFVTNNYLGGCVAQSTQANNAGGFVFAVGLTASSRVSSHCVITSPDGYTWHLLGSTFSHPNSHMGYVAGSLTLSEPLTRIRITSVSGADEFDAGTVHLRGEA
jgi:hypothetical protein